ncbi:hypothetical protein YPPY15_3543, partial [Yersinia pestis PY-15]
MWSSPTVAVTAYAPEAIALSIPEVGRWTLQHLTAEPLDGNSA